MKYNTIPRRLLLPVSASIAIVMALIVTLAPPRYGLGLGAEPSARRAIQLGAPMSTARLTATEAVSLAKANWPARFPSDSPVNVCFGSLDPHLSPKGSDGQYHALGKIDAWVVHVSGITVYGPGDYWDPGPKPVYHNAYFIIQDSTEKVLEEADLP